MPTFKMGYSPKSSAEEERRVEKQWRAYPDLFDGPLIQLLGREEEALVVTRSSYRYWICQEEFTALGVSGILQNKGRFLVAKRSENVRFPGIWEFAPAGTLTDLDSEEQLKRELFEELGVAEKRILEMHYVGLAEDKKTRVVDLCYKILLQDDQIELNDEYEEARWVTIYDLQHFAEPTTDLFLELKKFL